MKSLKKPALVFFNASVILAAIKSPNGGSGKLISWVKNHKIKGIISEIIFHEVLKNASKTGFNELIVKKKVENIFPVVIKKPDSNIVDKFKNKIIDQGDAHILASAKEVGADYLVSLDKKHILILKNKIKNFIILSPGDLIEKLSSNKS